jgi:1-acyl-sn-glycerol-3-phosphate acyltransferase
MVRFVWSFFATVALTLVFSTLALLSVIVAPFTQAVAHVSRWWAKVLVRVCSVELEVEGLEHAQPGRPYLVMANHTSHFDVPCLFASVPILVRPVAKKELAFIPVFGWVLWLGAAIMIDRGDRQRAVASIERAGRTIRGGRSVLMFPEGTRTPPGELGPLKKGPFHLAITARVPVLPIGLVGTGAVLRRGDWRIHPGRVSVRIGAPIDTAGLSDDEAGRAILADRTALALADLMGRPASARKGA